MNKTHIKRLRTLARVLEEADRVPLFRKLFTMTSWGWGNKNAHGLIADCGTPACALGHYAARTDVQRSFELDFEGEITYQGSKVNVVQAAVDHFGIDYSDHHDLFSGSGCGGATRPKAAAKFIERFTNRMEKQYGLVTKQPSN